MKPLYIKFTITWILIFLIYSISSSLYAQNKTLKVTGTVYDESGITLPSVTITVKGQKGVGVLSDNDGKFTISVPEGATLVFSFVGMKSQEVIVNAKQIPYKVILQEDSKSLEEVVVTGYQTLKKHEVVGSTYTVKGDDVRIAGINRIDAALQGMIPGVSIRFLPDLSVLLLKSEFEGLRLLLETHPQFGLLTVSSKKIPFLLLEHN